MLDIIWPGIRQVVVQLVPEPQPVVAKHAQLPENIAPVEIRYQKQNVPLAIIAREQPHHPNVIQQLILTMVDANVPSAIQATEEVP
jgi:hypothetical protein